MLTLLYTIPTACWNGSPNRLIEQDWALVRATGFFIGPLQNAVEVYRTNLRFSQDSGLPVDTGEALLVRYFANTEAQYATTIVAVSFQGDALPSLGAELYGVERSEPWAYAVKRVLGGRLGDLVQCANADTKPFQPIGRAALVGNGGVNPAGSVATDETDAGIQPIVVAASRFLRNSTTLGRREHHWYEPDDDSAKVVGTACGFVVMSANNRFTTPPEGGLNQMERFIILHGLAYAYRQALLHPSDWLATDWDGSPSTLHEAEANYYAVQELYDKQVKFQARYLFSAPVDEDKPEVYGMAEAVLRWRGIRHLRADIESQLDRFRNCPRASSPSAKRAAAKAKRAGPSYVNGCSTSPWPYSES